MRLTSALARLITLRMTVWVSPSRDSSSSRYSSMLNSLLSMPAIPSATAASATADATHTSTRRSNGLGMMYSLPNWMLSSPYACETVSGTGSLARAASALVAAIFIPAVIPLAMQSSAPRKMYGKPSTLFT